MSHLGISPEMMKVIVDTEGESDPARVKELYNVAENENLDSLQEVSTFLETTGITGEELVLLLHPSPNFLNTEEYYTNAGLSGYPPVSG